MQPLGASLVFVHLILAASARRSSTASPVVRSRPSRSLGSCEKYPRVSPPTPSISRRISRAPPLDRPRTQRRRRWMDPTTLFFVAPSASRFPDGMRRRITVAPPSAKFRNFEEMLEGNSRSPVLVNFYARWCGPCRLLKREMSEVKRKFAVHVRSGDSDGGKFRVWGEGGSGGAANGDFTGRRETVALERRLGGGRKKSVGEVETEGGGKSERRLIGGLKVFHVDTERFPQVGSRNNVRGLPTMVLFVKGKEVWRAEGLLLADDIVEKIQPFIEGGGCREES